jgi:hypothetical protein
MAKNQIRVVGKYRPEVDTEQLAAALLAYINSLPDADKRKLSRGGESRPKRQPASRRTKGSAE